VSAARRVKGSTWRAALRVAGLLPLLLGSADALHSQIPDELASPPRLTVVIVVDQLRPDYLTRFRPYFGEGGFRRFLEGGSYFPSARYQHAVTATCPGHATVMTGAYARTNGIIANTWWNLAEGREEYCSRDDSTPLLGISGEGRSPRNLIGSTVGDELKMATNGAARVLSISGKDRAAIMLGGHMADAAYFMEDTLVVSSSYYQPQLPEWVNRFNASSPVTAYFGREWDRILPAEAYAGLGPDDAPGERIKPGMDRAFPHLIDGGADQPDADFVEAFEYSPFQNELVLAFAKELIRSERLGQDGVPDVLGIGFSANDRIGHAFGPHSHEVMDVTVRTDRLLADLFDFLEAEVGLDRVVVVLTSDHGVAPLPEALPEKTHSLGARLAPETVLAAAEAALIENFGSAPHGTWVAWQDGPYVYLDERSFEAAGIPIVAAETVVADALLSVPGISMTWTRTTLEDGAIGGSDSAVQLSFHHDRSGHVMYVTDPGVVEQGESDGTTHGSPWGYDQQVPVLWFGSGIAAGVHHGAAYVSDIAPTLSALLQVPIPSGSQGRVLAEIFH